VGARNVHWRRVLAIVLLVAFGLGTSQATIVAAPSCFGRCPVDCPMHAKGRRCHAPGWVGHMSGGDHCHRQRSQGPGLHAAGCQGRPDGFAQSHQPALLPALVYHPMTVQRRERLNRAQPPTTAAALDPPFHPPRSTAHHA